MNKAFSYLVAKICLIVTFFDRRESLKWLFQYFLDYPAFGAMV